MSKEFYGIDLGTTYSCIARIDSDDLVRVIPTASDRMVTPSAVYFDDENKMQVGQAAKAHLGDRPENTVVFIKREMSNKDYVVTINGKTYDPVEISSFILKHLVDTANKKIKDEEGKAPIYDVVITVPAYFGNIECTRTKEAGIKAGLNVMQLIAEPTAAAISYGRKMQGDKNLLVYDLGGGTFDVSILNFKSGIVNTKAARGDHHLGGVDWDAALAKIALSKINASFDAIKEDTTKNQILGAAKNCKQLLTDNDSAVMQFNYKGIQAIEVTRQEFESATHSLMTRTSLLVQEALDAANMTKEDIDEVILVGGSSRMPMVPRMVQEIIGKTPKLIDPDMAVAKGAALMASQTDKGYVEGGIAFGKDKGSRAYGMNVVNDKVDRELCFNLIRRNDDKEIEKQFEFFTNGDNQTNVVLHFYENESNEEWKEIDPAEEIEGKTGSIEWGYPVPKGTPVKVIVKRDNSGCVRIFAECCGAKGEFEIVTSIDSNIIKK